MGFGVDDPRHLVEPIGDDGRDVVVGPDAHQGDQVDLAGDGVDLADAVDLGDGGGNLGNAGHVGLHEHDGSDHGVNLAWA